MTKLERKLFSQLVSLYLDGKISRVCSDFDAAKEASLTLEQCDELHVRMAFWNGDLENARTGALFDDWYLAAFLKHLFDFETKEIKDA